MERGTAASMSASREGTPIASSMGATSDSAIPMCRSAKDIGLLTDMFGS
jgi:hypothetical protein